MEQLCKIRDIYRTISAYEADFQKAHGLSLNEGMLLCTLEKKDGLTSGDIALELGLSTSNTSKIIALVEDKKWIKRSIDKVDRRQMCFSLTIAGSKQLQAVKTNTIPIPKMLQQLLN